MSSKELLIKQFKSYKVVEKSAEDLYSSLINNLHDKKVIKVLEAIKVDEQKHQEICQEIINIVENNLNS